MEVPDMKQHSKLARFFIVCSVIFFIGVILTVTGLATGGGKNIEKLAEHYDWISSPGERGITTYKAEDFHSIEATGDVDLWILGSGYYGDSSWVEKEGLLESTEMDNIAPNQVTVICGDRMGQPEITVENGILKINSGPVDFNGINLNLDEATFYPRILICVPDQILESLNVSGQTGDVNIMGVGWKKADIQMNTGDMTFEEADSRGLTIDADTSDMELEGTFTGKTKVRTETGDLDLTTSLARKEYDLTAKTSAGDVKILEAGKTVKEFEDENEVSRKGGPNKMTITTDTGDITLNFQKK